MRSGPTFFSRSLDLVASARALVEDGLRRLRYRRAALQRLPAAETGPDHRSASERPRWTAAIRIGTRAHNALMCGPNSHLSYEVSLPGDATIVSWCALAPDAWTPNMGRVEFAIEVRAQGVQSSARRWSDSIGAGRSCASGRRGPDPAHCALDESGDRGSRALGPWGLGRRRLRALGRPMYPDASPSGELLLGASHDRFQLGVRGLWQKTVTKATTSTPSGCAKTGHRAAPCAQSGTGRTRGQQFLPS